MLPSQTILAAMNAMASGDEDAIAALGILLEQRDYFDYRSSRRR